MAKDSLTPAKLRDLTVDELQMRLDELKQLHFKLRVRATTKELKSPSDIRSTKRAIARIHTILRQKEQAAG